MIVEILEFELVHGTGPDFVDRNERIWTPALRARKGYLGREILISSEDPDRIVIIVRWNDRADLEAFPKDEQDRLDRAFDGLVRRRAQRVHQRILPI